MLNENNVINGQRGTQVTVSDSATNNVDIIMHTVTAGTVFYLTSCTVVLAATGTYVSITVRNGADVHQYTLVASKIQLGQGSYHAVLTFPKPIAIPAGWDVMLTKSGCLTYGSQITGWEE